MARIQLPLATLALAASLTSVTARASDPTTVTAVLQPNKTLEFDAPLPAGAYFNLQFKVDDPAHSNATLRVWPKASTGSCTPDWKKLKGTRQFHELGMTATGTGPDAALTAKVPPLQVGQPFCVSLDVFVPLESLGDFAARIAERAVAGVSGPTPNIGATVSAAVFQRGLPSATEIGNAVKDRVGTALTDYTAADARRKASLPPLNPTAQQSQEYKDGIAQLDQKVADAKKALNDKIVGIIMSPDISKLIVRETVVSTDAVAGEGTTPAAANYASLDTGVVAAFPLAYAGGDGNPWVLPYVGLNLYFKPVDRTLALSELVDSGYQHISLTIGRTLTNPSIPNRTITDFGFGYPLLAVGYRVSQFIRATAGTVFYRINDKNPTSTHTTFGVAPFIGMSLDADVIAIAQGKLTAPN